MKIPWNKLCDHIEVIKPPSADELMALADNFWQGYFRSTITRREEVLERLKKCKSFRPLKSSMRELTFDRPLEKQEQVFLDTLDKYISVQT